MWVVREGYEGLVRGNAQAAEERAVLANVVAEAEVLADEDDAERELNYHQPQLSGRKPDQNLLKNLRFGDGDLLRDGTSEYVSGRTLKGRYIVQVGWDDVRGWFSEARAKP